MTTLITKKFLLLIMFSVIMLNAISQNERIVLIETSLGDIKVKLYNETPLHRDNFIKLAEEFFFDSLLFHRVIHEFMIQGGDPDSKNAIAGARLGNGGPGYQIPAEFNSNLFHKKGVIAAAREGDQVNPLKKSSGSQFYIVHGKVFPDSVLTMMEQKINDRNKQMAINNYLQLPENKFHRDNMLTLQQSGDRDAVMDYLAKLEEKAQDEINKIEPFKFTPEQRKIYTTTGGTPHLDGAYTVFGEVIEGLEVVDMIAKVQTDKNDRPLENVHMIIRVIK